MTSQPPCPACQGSRSQLYGSFNDEEYFSAGGPYRYVRCEDCGTVFLPDPPVERLAEIYPHNYYSFVPSRLSAVQAIKQRLDSRLFRRVLETIPGESLRALDIGGGTGWQLGLLRDSDHRVTHTTVVDIDAAAADVARSSGHEFHGQRLEDFESDERFDVVLMLNLIEHVADPAEMLRKVRSLLSEHGRVIVKTPNADAWDARLFRRSYWAGLHVPRHWVVFNRASFERMLSGTGLECIEFRYTQGAPFWAASVLAAAARRGWTEVSARRPAPYHPLFPALLAFFAGVDFLRAPLARTSQMFLVLARA
jgi:2-polyprenyl-3-methyl-5-hydroxy-6-metoxy-1,4-benzoquinol methylase